MLHNDRRKADVGATLLLSLREVPASMRDNFYSHSNDLWHCWAAGACSGSTEKSSFLQGRQNLALLEGFLLLKGKPKMHSTVCDGAFDIASVAVTTLSCS